MALTTAIIIMAIVADPINVAAADTAMPQQSSLVPQWRPAAADAAGAAAAASAVTVAVTATTALLLLPLRCCY